MDNLDKKIYKKISENTIKELITLNDILTIPIRIEEKQLFKLNSTTINLMSMLIMSKKKKIL